MRRTRKTAKKPVIDDSSSSDDDIPLKKLQKTSEKNVTITAEKKNNDNDDSSSESDIENYLQRADKIDLNSSFFNIQKKNENVFDKIEKNIFAGITRLSDSDSDEDTTQSDPRSPENNELEQPGTSKLIIKETKLNFHQLEEYTKRIEEAKRHVEEYKARKIAEENNEDISNMLAAGESKQMTMENIKPEDLHSSDFESCESEKEEWEEVKIKESQESKEKELIPKDGVQITVNMPDTCRKKKGVDLITAMKRRLNRIRKENQVYVHKVHLLCWIAHGNFVSSTINNTEILGLALSLLPSDKCYPSERTDLSYLEQIVQWYKKTIILDEKNKSKKKLENAMQEQISKKTAYTKQMLVYIFVAVLRALGIQCRLVLSFQVEPLRPPASELHSLAKEDTKNSSSKKDNKQLKKEDKKEVDCEGVLEEKSDTHKSTDKRKELSPSKKEPTIKESKNKAAKIEGTKSDYSQTKSQNTDLKKEKSNKSSSSKETQLRKDDSSKHPVKNGTEGKKSVPNQNADKIQKAQLKKEDTSKKSTSSMGKELKKEPLKSEKVVNLRGNSVEGSLIKIKNKRGEKRNTQNKVQVLKSGDNIKNEKLTTNKPAGLSAKGYASKTESIDKNKPHSKSKGAAGKNIIKVKFPKKEKQVPQLDGINDSSDENLYSSILQLDGANDKSKKDSKTKKPNLKKLNSSFGNICEVKKHPTRFKSVTEDYNSENEFRPRSPFSRKNSLDSPKPSQNREVNLQKLKKSPIKMNSPPQKKMDVKNDIINLIKGRIAEQKHIDRGRTVKKRKSSTYSDSDSDYMPEPIKKKHHDSDSDIEYFVPKPKVKQRVRVQRNESKNTESEISKYSHRNKRKYADVWVEVFLESEEKWISADIVQGQVHCVNEIFTRATHPISYIVAWNNNNTIKDITRRYCTNFNTITRKLRVDAKWWDETLKPFVGKYTARDREEDDDLNRQQLDQPLPKSIAEFKNHPLYALRRHLLKFEDIYPPDVQPLGYIRGEPVYPRNCVYVCRSRDIWVKEARVVKPGEKPYKIVKARPKYDKLSNQIITDQLLEIFGEWQTTAYVPPTAENGVVPRNAFGNVELFKRCMLPKGTVHLQLPGLNKICRRMNIDCAPAIVGFDFHGGWSHPTYDGFVVCEEFADILVAAWDMEQEEIEKRENEKIEKRVYGNWKRLIKGLLIRERLKAKYDFGASTSGESSKDKKKAKGPKFCTKKKNT